MKNGSVKVISIRRSPRPPLLAYADVQVGDWILYDWRLIQQDNGRVWVSVPQSSHLDREGKRQYRSLLAIPKELQQRIETALLYAWDQEIRNEAHDQ